MKPSLMSNKSGRSLSRSFTSISEGLEADELSDLMDEYLTPMTRIVHESEGTIDKYIGDAIMAVFGAPRAHEDDPERALHCALELTQIPGIDIHAGVNSGFVFCGQVGSELRQEYTVMGDAVNLAARLMQLAQPGQILVSKKSQSECLDCFSWGNQLTLQAKGKAELVTMNWLGHLE